MTLRTTTLFIALLLALAGCDNGNGNPDGGPGTDGGPTPDGGPPPDGGPTPDGGPAGACAAPRAVTLTTGEQTLSGDTTGRASDLTLSSGCGGGASPQEILALTIPGEGRQGVAFDLRSATTEFDTLVELRPTACDSTAAAECFDDTGFDVRSSGAFFADGGSTVHLVVTGYDADESGAWGMTVEVGPANAPTVSGADVIRVGTSRYDILVDGGDVDADAAGIRVTFLDSAGAPIAFGGNSEFGIRFDESQIGNTTFTGALVRIADDDFLASTAAAVEARIAVLDRFGQASEPMTFSVRDATLAGVGETCDADALCGVGVECTDGTCRIPPATVTACEAASTLTVTATEPATATGTITPAEPNSLFGSCADTSGPEALYRVTLPAVGTFDLIASTDNEGTGDADTVVYIQSECGDPATEVACDDDADGADFRSVAVASDLTGGTYTIAVEMYGEPDVATGFQLDVRLRPVLAPGLPCDPTGVENRCQTGTCPAGETPLCPVL